MKEQIEKIDNSLLAACGVLIAAYFVLYGSNTPKTYLFNVITITSLIFLSVCFLLTLYAKYRTSLRQDITNRKMEEWRKDLNENLDKYVSDFITPQLMKSTRNTLEKNKSLNLNPEDFKKALKTDWDAWNKDLEIPKNLFAENQLQKIEKVLNTTYGPLQEKNGLIKYQLEVFTGKRYSIFVIGLICFIVSIGMKLFS